MTGSILPAEGEHLTNGWEPDAPDDDTLKRPRGAGARVVAGRASPVRWAGRGAVRTGGPGPWSASGPASWTNPVVLTAPVTDAEAAGVVAEIGDLVPRARPTSCSRLAHPGLRPPRPGAARPPAADAAVPGAAAPARPGRRRGPGGHRRRDPRGRGAGAHRGLPDARGAPGSVLDPGLLGGSTRVWLGYVDGEPASVAAAHQAAARPSWSTSPRCPPHGARAPAPRSPGPRRSPTPERPAVLVASDDGRPTYASDGLPARRAVDGLAAPEASARSGLMRDDGRTAAHPTARSTIGTSHRSSRGSPAGAGDRPGRRPDPHGLPSPWLVTRHGRACAIGRAGGRDPVGRRRGRARWWRSRSTASTPTRSAQRSAATRHAGLAPARSTDGASDAERAHGVRTHDHAAQPHRHGHRPMDHRGGRPPGHVQRGQRPHAHRTGAGGYVASMFDVAQRPRPQHRVLLGEGQVRLPQPVLEPRPTAPATGSGAADGRDKIDRYTVSPPRPANVTRLLRRLRDGPDELSFVHIAYPDRAGHASGFMSPAYVRAVRAADTQVGRILDAVTADTPVAPARDRGADRRPRRNRRRGTPTPRRP